MVQKLANTNIMDINDSEKKIRYIFQGSHRLYLDSIFKKTSSTNIQNATIFYEFLITEYNTQNVRINTTLTYIKIISLFSEFVHYKDFEKITKNDIIDFLNSSRKLESEDPSHKWIGTYNTRRMILSKFFRWFYNQYQNNEMDQKKWITPNCMQGVKQFPRKEKSTYKPSDIWIDEESCIIFEILSRKKRQVVIMQWQMILLQTA